MIRVQSVFKAYGNNYILNDINLNINKDEFVFLVGPNGVGKSTLLKMFYRAEVPSKGNVTIGRFNLSKLTPGQIPLLRRSVGVIFQDYKLLLRRTVYENVAFALEVVGKGHGEIYRRVHQVLELVNLTHKVKDLPGTLSGGEQQKVCIARALINNPPILLADEPTGNLDPDTSWEIMHLLEKINESGTIVVVATHDKEIVDNMRKRVVEIKYGKIVRDQNLGIYKNAE